VLFKGIHQYKNIFFKISKAAFAIG